MIGLILLAAFFAFPETAYVREPPRNDGESSVPPLSSSEKASAMSSASASDVERTSRPVPAKMTYLQSLKIFHRTVTDENLFRLLVRPFGLICLPPVLWVSLVSGTTIGFLVAMNSNVEIAFVSAYHFQSWQVGLCFISAIIGSLIGIPAGGTFGDQVADWFTKRNGGIRDPEMRLPAMILSMITAPLGLILFGVGVEYQLHWICSTIGIGLCKLCSGVFFFLPLSF